LRLLADARVGELAQNDLAPRPHASRLYLGFYAGNKTRTMRREEPERLTPQAPD